MPPLHPPPAMSTAAHMNPKFNVLHPRFRNLGLKLGHRLAFLKLASATGTPRGQWHFDNFIDLLGDGPTIGASIPLSWFASGLFGSGLGILPREGSGLSLHGSQRLFQQSLQACVLFLQCFDLTFELPNFLCARHFSHTDTLVGLRVETTAISEIHEGKCLDAKQIRLDFSTPFAPGPDNLSYINVNGSATSGLLDFGVHPTFGGHSAVNQFVAGDQVSISQGKNTFRTGFEAEWVEVSTVSGSGSVGQPTFPSFADFLIGRAGCGAGTVVTPTPGNLGGCNGATASNMTNQGGTTAANPGVQLTSRPLVQQLLSRRLQGERAPNSQSRLAVGTGQLADGEAWKLQHRLAELNDERGAAIRHRSW